jgi:hypothetical protein
MEGRAPTPSDGRSIWSGQDDPEASGRRGKLAVSDMNRKNG